MTTIDTLQIEIESTSASAANGIRELAGAMGVLKQNATVSTAVKNLNGLKTALQGFTSVTSNHKKIRELASALERLQEVKPLGSFSNSIRRLPAALNELNTVNIKEASEQIKDIANAVTPLSTIKASGFTSLVNSLRKIGSITESLDGDTIENFADRVRALCTALAPLSSQMTSIQVGFKGIRTHARSAGSSVQKMGSHVNSTSLNLSTMIYIVKSVIQWLQTAIRKFTEFIDEAIEWEGVSNRFGRGFGAQAQEAYQWIQKLNDAMGINIQQFMQYSSIYVNMLTGYGVAAEDAAKMAMGYTELTYDIWAGYNDIYSSYADAADAVKSAIAGEVEPIRKAGFTIVDSQLAVTAANHGVKYSTQDATEAQKSYLRYLTLVDQAHDQNLIGTYAKELGTAEGLVRTLTQQLKSLAQSFGSLFLPALTAVIPYIQAFVDLLTEAVQKIALLFGIQIQSVDDWGNTTDGIDSVTDSAEAATGAVKELKKSLLSIDELTILPSESSGGGGSAGTSGWTDLDVESLWDESIFDNIQTQVESIKNTLEPLFDKAFDFVLDIRDLVFRWDNLNAEDIAAKIVTGLTAVLGAVAGFSIAGLKGGVLGLLIGTAIGAVIQNLIFDHDGKISPNEVLKLLCSSLAGLAGGIIGFHVGGIGGAAIGATIGMSVGAYLSNLVFSNDGVLAERTVAAGIVMALGALVGGIIGFYFGGVPGALIGAGIGATATLTLLDLHFRHEDEIGKGLLGSRAKEVLLGITGGAIGFFFGAWLGGPAGALVGALIGATATLIFQELLLNSDTTLSKTEIFNLLSNTLLTAGFGLMGGILGMYLAGPTGALLGISIGVLLSLVVQSIDTSNVTTTANEALGSLATRTPVSITGSYGGLMSYGYASGGFPAVGQMFIAREAGPEMVGTIGHRTAVANNDQIVEGIAAGVQGANEGMISAMYAAASQIVQAVNSKDNNLYLDSKKITTAQNQRSRAYGV